MSGSKKYGLIMPEKAQTKQPVFQSARNIFGNDSDSDDEAIKKPVLLRPSDNINRQAKKAQQNALMEDPTVYQYDEIYDAMVSKKDEKKVKTTEEKKPRYIENLLKTANKRKLENERRIERQIQKEREKEGEEFADKEVFVTSAYKKKLEEMSLEEEKEKREEYLESIGDVTKQRDLGGFYRHLYEQKLGPDENTVKPNNLSSTKQDKSDIHNRKDLEVKLEETQRKEVPKKRNYRKRKTSDEITEQLSDGEIADSGDEINRLNLSDIRSKRLKKCEENIDADSDFSIEESSDDNEDDSNKKADEKISHDSPNNNEHQKKKINLDEKAEKSDTKKSEPTIEPKTKIDIWKKRTVGEVFEQALQRYYERKATRGY